MNSKSIFFSTMIAIIAALIYVFFIRGADFWDAAAGVQRSYYLSDYVSKTYGRELPARFKRAELMRDKLVVTFEDGREYCFARSFRNGCGRSLTPEEVNLYGVFNADAYGIGEGGRKLVLVREGKQVVVKTNLDRTRKHPDLATKTIDHLMSRTGALHYAIQRELEGHDNERAWRKAEESVFLAAKPAN